MATTNYPICTDKYPHLILQRGTAHAIVEWVPNNKPLDSVPYDRRVRIYLASVISGFHIRMLRLTRSNQSIDCRTCRTDIYVLWRTQKALRLNEVVWRANY